MTDAGRRADESRWREHCACLRTKGMYLPPNPRADGNTPEGSPTAVFWCLKTMKVTGPDEGYVAPDACTAPRACYRPRP